ncbi:MAG: hypothetical protein NTV01_03325 [Bacteroidia bacterium]|nr:hypothetical protein [Bacteroidia bacterium]
MKNRIFLAIALFGFISSCNQSTYIDGIYRYYWGEKEGYKVWFVDGNRVRLKLYREFLYGGNEQRYLFNPKGEIWIDNAVSCEEFEMTLAHELNERHLMAKFGWTYVVAHDSSLAVELIMRHKFEQICRAYEESLPKMPVLDYENIKEIKDIPDSIQLKNIYRVPMGERNGIKVWIVDGYLVRKTFYPDFGFSGNDLSYHFIPPKEIWIDGQISGEETEYSIATELMERDLMSKGISYSDAYETAIADDRVKREKMDELIRQHPPVAIPDSTSRDAGVIDPAERN